MSLNSFEINHSNIVEISDNVVDKTAHRVLLIAARANDLVVSRLIDGAKRAFVNEGLSLSQLSLMRVNGALEIPLALNKAATTGRFNTFVVLGAVIKGKTDHYDHVARMANDGVLDVALRHHLAVGNGILTVHSLEHALERADGPCGNLGCDAARAALGLSASFLELEKSNRA